MQDNPNRLQRPPVKSWRSPASPRPAAADVHGRPVVNSAGDPFPEAVLGDDVRLVLEITRNLPAFDEGMACRYKNCVNADTFEGIAPRLLRVETITAEPAFEDGLFYWRVTARCEYLG